jgi:hypothetical protein
VCGASANKIPVFISDRLNAFDVGNENIGFIFISAVDGFKA